MGGRSAVVMPPQQVIKFSRTLAFHQHTWNSSTAHLSWGGDRVDDICL